MRKNVYMNVTAALLTLWYCMSIIGFDIHTCRESGRSFVATFVEGLTCQDIHPEHDCDAGHCCGVHVEEKCSCGHDHHGQEGSLCEDADGYVIKAPSCCTNDYQVLNLTGGGQDESGHLRIADVQFITVQHVVSAADIHSLSVNSGLRAHCFPDPWVHSRGDIQLYCNIWRI